MSLPLSLVRQSDREIVFSYSRVIIHLAFKGDRTPVVLGEFLDEPTVMRAVLSSLGAEAVRCEDEQSGLNSSDGVGSLLCVKAAARVAPSHVWGIEEIVAPLD